MLGIRERRRSSGGLLDPAQNQIFWKRAARSAEGKKDKAGGETESSRAASEKQSPGHIIPSEKDARLTLTCAIKMLRLAWTAPGVFRRSNILGRNRKGCPAFRRQFVLLSDLRKATSVKKERRWSRRPERTKSFYP